MKKLFLLILVVVMSFTIVACGGGTEAVANNDENNAAMQVKVDELQAISQEIISWYEDNGYLEGETAAQVQPVVDNLKASTDEILASHKKQIEDGGYTDEDVARISIPMDESIVKYNELKEKQTAMEESLKASPEIAVLREKGSQLVSIVNEVSTTALANGWENDEELNSELNAAFEFLEIVKSDLEVPESMDEEYINTIIASIDEMIPAWQDFLVQVSEPYVKK